jgi:heat shock protein HslJ
MAQLEFQILPDEYELIALPGNESMMNMFSHKTPTIQFDIETGKLGGNTGCNTYFGTFTFRPGQLLLHVKGSTRMFCQGVPEEELVNILQQVSGFKRLGNKVYLTNGRSDVAIFEKK